MIDLTRYILKRKLHKRLKLLSTRSTMTSLNKNTYNVSTAKIFNANESIVQLYHFE